MNLEIPKFRSAHQINRPLNRRNSVLAGMTALVAAAASACASTPPKKSVLKMTINDYILGHPDCVKVTRRPDGPAVIRDVSQCDADYEAAQEKALEEQRSKWTKKPSNPTEGERYQRTFHDEAEQQQPATPWWKANMEQKKDESVKVWAERVEKIARDFLSGKYGDFMQRAETCSGDKNCFAYLQQSFTQETDLAEAYAAQAVKAWEVAATETTGLISGEYERRAENLKREFDRGILQLRRATADLLKIDQLSR